MEIGAELLPDALTASFGFVLFDPVQVPTFEMRIGVDSHQPVMRAGLIADFGVELCEVCKTELNSSPAVILVELDARISAQILLALVCVVLWLGAIRGAFAMTLVPTSTSPACARR